MKRIIKSIPLLIVILSLSCNTHHYVVKAGDNYSTHVPTLLNSDEIKYSFTTDSSWVWVEPVLNGWSKVTGIAWNSNHENSNRIVYMRSGDIGLLGYYYYIEGVSPQENPLQKGILDTIVIGNTYQGRIGYENGFYFNTMNDKHHSIKVDKPSGVKTLGNLYIGGRYTITHDWKTTVKWR